MRLVTIRYDIQFQLRICILYVTLCNVNVINRAMAKNRLTVDTSIV